MGYKFAFTFVPLHSKEEPGRDSMDARYGQKTKARLLKTAIIVLNSAKSAQISILHEVIWKNLLIFAQCKKLLIYIQTIKYGTRFICSDDYSSCSQYCV